MTKKEFFNRISDSKKDFVKYFFKILKRKKIKFCIIGGLAVNVYAEPVVSLDIDVVVSKDRLSELIDELRKNFKVKEFEHSINISYKYSDLRIQIQTDEIYQDFIKRSKKKMVLGYNLPVASIEDVLKGKVMAYLDKERRESKRQKDLADIIRLIEVKPEIINLLPEELKKKIREV
jgi:hypothetical protein